MSKPKEVPMIVGRKYSVGAHWAIRGPWTLVSKSKGERAWESPLGYLLPRYNSWRDEVQSYGLELLPDNPEKAPDLAAEVARLKADKAELVTVLDRFFEEMKDNNGDMSFATIALVRATIAKHKEPTE